MKKDFLKRDDIYSKGRSLTSGTLRKHTENKEFNVAHPAVDGLEESTTVDAACGTDGCLANTTKRNGESNAHNSNEIGLSQMVGGESEKTARSGRLHATDYNSLHQSEYLKNPIEKFKVRNCYSLVNPFDTVKNQFIITVRTKKGQKEVFQSYNTVIAVIDENRQVWLDYHWDYSSTTGKYRNQFLGETIKETRKKIASGEYKVTNLN